MAHASFVIITGSSSSLRCKSTLDSSHPLPNLESPDTADPADSSRNISVAVRDTSGQGRGKQPPRTKWTLDERRKLKDAVANGMTIKAIAAQFPTRSVASVTGQCHDVHHDGDYDGEISSRRARRKWSRDEVELLRKLLANGLQASHLRAYFPDRSVWSIFYASRAYSSAPESCPKKSSRWSPEDDKRLTELSQSRHRNAVAEALGRSLSSVEVRASKMGIKLISSKQEYTAEEIATILQMRRDKIPPKDIAKSLGRKTNSANLAYYRHRPLEDGDAKVQKVRLSVEELENIKTLRAQGLLWPDIGSRYPMHDIDQIVEEYRRRAGSSLSASEVQEIERLRKAGATWRELFASGQFYHNRPEALRLAYVRTLERQKSQP